MKYLLDSVVVIDHFNGIAAATAFLAEHGADCVLSVITCAETLAGFDDDAETMARELLDCFPALPVTAAIADTAARLKRRTGLKLPDALQAAAAIEHGLTLVTRDARDFRSGNGPAVLVPYRL